MTFMAALASSASAASFLASSAAMRSFSATSCDRSKRDYCQHAIVVLTLARIYMPQIDTKSKLDACATLKRVNAIPLPSTHLAISYSSGQTVWTNAIGFVEH